MKVLQKFKFLESARVGFLFTTICIYTFFLILLLLLLLLSGYCNTGGNKQPVGFVDSSFYA